MDLLAGYWCFTALSMAYCAWDNGRLFFRPPKSVPGRRKWPLLSVLVPARNEEGRIGPCLESLLRQDYPSYEILVLDDRSTDRTFNVVRSYAGRNRAAGRGVSGKGPRLEVLRGRELPAGWIGKPWACHQLARRARGEWLLFTDADTRHNPDMLKRSLQAAEGRGADLLTYVTRQETGSWMESLVVPVMVFFLVSFLPVRRTLKPGGFLSRFAGAGGQFLLFRRRAYEAIGGHGSVRNQIVEDLKIGGRIVERGFKLVPADGTDLVACRMYRSAREVWEGFSKNFFPLYGFSIPSIFLNFLFMAVVTVLPFLVPFFAAPGSPLFDAALGLAVLQVGVRLFQAVRYRMALWPAFLHPVGTFLFLLIGLNSVRWYAFRKQGRWKGRVLRPPSPVKQRF